MSKSNNTWGRKTLALLLTAVMVLALLPFTAVPALAAADDFKIGGTPYTTLAAAVAAVQDGQTIVMQRDVVTYSTVALNVNKTYTIDFGGYELYGYGSAMGQTVLGISAGNVTLQNGHVIGYKNGTVFWCDYAVYVHNSGTKVNILSGGYTSYIAGVRCMAGATVIITSGNFHKRANGASALTAESGSNMSLAPGSVADVDPWKNNSAAADIKVTVTPAFSIRGHGGYATYDTLEEIMRYVAYDGMIIDVLYDVTLTSTAVLDANKTYTLDLGGHTLSGPGGSDTLLRINAGNVTLQNGVLQTDSAYGVFVAGGAVNILSGDYTAYDDAVNCAGGSVTVTISGGRFRETRNGGDGALYGLNISLAPGSTASVNPWQGAGVNDVTVTPAGFRVVGLAQYATLAEAEANLPDGGTIEMQRDVTLSSMAELNANKTYTLDFGGHTLSGPSGSGNTLLQINAGNVTLQNGVMQTDSHFGLAVRNGATVNILSGDYSAYDDAVTCLPGSTVIITAGRFRETNSDGRDALIDGALVGDGISLAPDSVASVNPWKGAGASEVTVKLKPAFKVGGNPYETLEDAAANLPNGGTIEMQRNVELYATTGAAARLDVNKTYTVDFGGYTLSGVSGGKTQFANSFLVVGAGNVTFQNGAVQTDSPYGIYVQNGAAANILSGDYLAYDDAIVCGGTSSESFIVITSGRFRETRSNGDGALYGDNIRLAPGSAANVNPWQDASDVTVHATGDTTPPTGEITIGSHGWNSFWNTVAFGLLCKNTQTVAITGSDDSGGTVTIEYYLSATELTPTEAEALTTQWQTYSGAVTINPNNKYIVYAKLTDASGNSVIINSAGIVVYTDSAAVTTSISFTKGSTTDVTATVNLNGNTISKIMNGAATLVSGMDYTVSGGTITFKANYLDNLTANSYTLTIYYNPLGVEYPASPLTGSEAPATTTIALTVNPQTYAVMVMSTGTGATGDGSYAENEMVSISAGTAPAGMRFKEWTANPSVTFADAANASTSFTMISQTVTVTAHFEAIPATVTGVTVNPFTVTVEKGTSYQFSATVIGTNSPPQTVTWTTESPIVAGTTIAADGTLTIDAAEIAATITVRATSTLAGYADKYGEATVTLSDTQVTPPTVTSIDVTPATITLNKGDNYTFSAAVNGTDNPPQGVAWAVEGGVPGTAITSGGALSIAANETATLLTVRATSTFDSAKSGTATITVTQLVPSHVPVTGINGVPATATAGTPLTLTGTVVPANATNQTITWSVKSAGTTGANISGDTLNTTAAGTVTVTATIANGTAAGTPYTQDFIITVSAAAANTHTIMASAGTGGSIAPSGSVTVNNGTNQTFTIAANSGYHISGVMVDGVNQGAIGTFTFASVIGSHTISASFAPDSTGGGNNGGNNGGGGGTTPPPTTPPPTTPPTTTPPTTTPTGDNGKTTDLPGGSTVETPKGQNPITNDDGSITLPGGGTITTPSGATITVPPGTVIDEDGSITFPAGSGGTITHGNGHSFGINEDAVIILDADVPLGYFVFIDNPFIDVKGGDWFYDSVMFAYSHGLMVGTSIEPMLFSPNMSTTRGMIVTMLYRMAGNPSASGLANPFDDVESGKWYTDAVKWAASNGIVSGIGGGKFTPEAPITRQDLAVILARYADFMGLKLPAKRNYTGFRDETDIANYAKEAIERFFKAGIISGKGNDIFDPKGQATRAEVAAMLHRFLEAVTEE